MIDTDPLQSLSSPTEERHIDFLLEEEFAVNPVFLPFFVQCAWKATSVAEHWAVDPAGPLPKCLRSVTTLDGESDVLVVYTNIANERVALLIEDKIGAGFQPAQAARYRQRGLRGLQDKQWHHYWTCLVAPATYAKENNDFDARVSIESLVDFFQAPERDLRSHFKANVLRASALKASLQGVKNVDAAVTEFHRAYAAVAKKMLQGSKWVPQEKEECFSQDSWFVYLRLLGKGIKCIHKPLMGAVQLIFPVAAEETLRQLLASDETDGLLLQKVGKLGVAVQVAVTKLEGYHSFNSTAQVNSLVAEAVHALGRLESFMLEHRDALRVVGLQLDREAYTPESKPDTVMLRMIEAQLFGFMWARAVQFGSTVAFAPPDLLTMSKDPSAPAYITVPGMSGGFTLLLRFDKSRTPVLFAQSESRIHADAMYTEIRHFNVYSEADTLDHSSLEEWAASRLATKDRE